MIVVCSNCTTRLEVGRAKVPPGLFTASCPNCQPDQSVSADAGDDAAGWRFEPTASIQGFDLNPHPSGSDWHPGSMPAAERSGVAQLLTTLLQQSLTDTAINRGALESPSPGRGRAIVCVEAAHRDVTERKLRESGYEVVAAFDAAQVFEQVRALTIDVVILDPEFSQAEQGTAFIERETGMLQPAKRRRIFFVHLSASARTADSHQAFLKDVNLVVNTKDIEALPTIIDNARRDFNDLYRDFNKALDTAAG